MATKKRLGGAVLGTSSATLYDPPTNGALVSTITVTNTTAAAATATLRIGGDTATYDVLSGINVAANETILITSGFPLANGDLVYGLADTAATISVNIYGLEY